MKRKFLRTLTVSTVLAMLLSVTAWAMSFVQGQEGNKQTASTAELPRSKTLREMAQQQDIERDMREGHFDREYGDLRWLAKDSDAIVLGRILQEESHFNGEDHIVTKYEVAVDRIIKDGTSEAIALWQSLGKRIPAPLRTPLRCGRAGGTVHVNGHRVSIKLKGSERVAPGRAYILFLQWNGGYYRIAGGMSGAVLVEENFRLDPLGTNQALKLKKYNELGFEAFIQEILTEPIQ